MNNYNIFYEKKMVKENSPGAKVGYFLFQIQLSTMPKMYKKTFCFIDTSRVDEYPGCSSVSSVTKTVFFPNLAQLNFFPVIVHESGKGVLLQTAFRLRHSVT